MPCSYCIGTCDPNAQLLAAHRWCMAWCCYWYTAASCSAHAGARLQQATGSVSGRRHRQRVVELNMKLAAACAWGSNFSTQESCAACAWMGCWQAGCVLQVQVASHMDRASPVPPATWLRW